jgi:CHASE2 domain-containing sensor protein
MAKDALVSHSLLRSSIVPFLLITLLVFLCVIGLRGEGYLESLELDAYDWSLRLRPSPSSVNPPITVVTITDQDIRELGQWPVTDEALAKVLDIVAKHHPRAIGVDIYRDLEVPPGRRELDRVLHAHPEIIMAMKFGPIEKGGILAPAIVRGTNRGGFTDVVVDADGIVRRGLLFMDDGTAVSQSLSFLLAQKYLEPEGIIPEPSSKSPEWVQMGQKGRVSHLDWRHHQRIPRGSPLGYSRGGGSDAQGEVDWGTRVQVVYKTGNITRGLSHNRYLFLDAVLGKFPGMVFQRNYSFFPFVFVPA